MCVPWLTCNITTKSVGARTAEPIFGRDDRVPGTIAQMPGEFHQKEIV